MMSILHLKLLSVFVALVGRTVASDTRYVKFESSHWQNFISNIFTVNC